MEKIIIDGKEFWKASDPPKIPMSIDKDILKNRREELEKNPFVKDSRTCFMSED